MRKIRQKILKHPKKQQRKINTRSDKESGNATKLRNNR